MFLTNTTNQSEIGNLAFMPWVTIKTTVTVGDWVISPVDLKKIKKEDTDIKRILKCYHIHAKLPIHTATLFTKDNGSTTTELTQNDRDDFFLLCEILSFCSLAEREFFSHGYYTNSSSHLPVLQSFRKGQPGFSIVSRRRDGSNYNYTDDEYHKVIQEPQVRNGDFYFDEIFATALLKSVPTDDWIQIFDGIFCYNKSNTDSNNVHLQTELMFGLGAFERLFGINNGKCIETAKALTEQLASALKEPAKDDSISRDLRQHSALTSIREAWMRDFCACRGDLAHGRTTPKYPSIWSPGEHLILAADIFPILVKIKLQGLGFYTLTDDDLRRIFYFDKRLRFSNLFRIGDDRVEPKFGWEEVRRKAVWEWKFQK